MSTNQELIALVQPEGNFELDWQGIEEPVDESQSLFQQEIFKRFQDNAAKTLLFLGFSDQTAPLSESLNYLRFISAAFVKDLAKNPDLELLREKSVVEIETDTIEHLLLSAPYLNGVEYLNQDWIIAVWERLNQAFSWEIKDYHGSAADFIASYNSKIHLAGRVFFHLVESKKDDYPFAFLATYSAGLSIDGKSRHLPLKNALIEYGKNSKKLLELLSTVNKASGKSAFISGLVESGEIFHPLGLSANDAYTVLKEIPLYEESGILCRIPNWWKNKSDSLRISVKIGNDNPSYLNFDTIVDFNIELSLGGESITVKEARKMLSEAEGLAFIKGKWVEVDHRKLTETLKAYEDAQKLTVESEMSLIEAMRLQLNAQKVLNIPKESCEFEVNNGAWLNSVIAKLTRPETIEPIDCGDDFQAQLRVYQERGLNWLYFMKNLGLGACLADDMGLGKTVQVIALLNYIRSKKNEKTLLIVPASLIGNWTNELLKFAPSLRYYVIHPSEKQDFENGDRSYLENNDIFITTYGMLLKYEWLKDIIWNTLVLDEAQAIKNPGAKQSKAVKEIKAEYKVAMTGTPIENRLSDLWSLFDFLNKGLLGTTKEFTDFIKQLKEGPDGYAKLKRVVSPFILRRLKTDKSIISDLPEKIEMKTYATLSKKQAVLYNKLVEDLKTILESDVEGIERKGLILASLMKFKQICNHPDQYLGQNYYAEDESGKYSRLREICETIYDKRERVLVFTQFKEIAGPLQNFLEKIFQHKGLVLHGEIAVAKRKDIVAEFQDHEYVPFLVLSIKAGGVGLNLTKANHVIHFDRWWNPAVENQATDRAFRIGQQKNVIVHKFITKGTIEEKIDLMIEDKTKLSQEIIPDLQENWITEMDNKKLLELFRLSV